MSDIMTTASWETWGQIYPDKLLLNSWPIETMWDNKYLSFFFFLKLLSFGVICFAAIDNLYDGFLIDNHQSNNKKTILIAQKPLMIVITPINSEKGRWWMGSLEKVNYFLNLEG